MKKASSPPPSFFRKLLIIVALVFLGLQTYAQEHVRHGYEIFNKGVRINGDNNPNTTQALSLHTLVPFEMDAHGIIGGRFRVTTHGLIGIGNPAPEFSLDVHADAKVSVAAGRPWGWVGRFYNTDTGSGILLGGRKRNEQSLAIIGAMDKTPLYINPDGGNIHLGNPDNPVADITVYGKFTSGHITTPGLTVNDGGKLGIGIANPTVELDVNGDIKATGKIIVDGGIEMNGSDAFHFDQNGSVGIGVNTDPNFRLDVSTPAKMSVTDGAPWGWVGRYYNTDTGSGILLGGRKRSEQSLAIIGAMDKTPLYINPDGGNIHLGNPDNPVADITAHGKFTSGHITTTGLSVNDFEIGHYIYEGTTSILNFVGPTKDAHIRIAKGIFSLKDDVQLQVDGGGIGGGRVMVSRNGNVGIGVTRPTEKLEVAGNIKATGKIIADGGVQLKNISETLYFAENGDVGIGVEPGTGENRKGKLHVKGSLHVENGDNNNQVFHVSGTTENVFVGSSAYSQWLAIKKNIDQMEPSVQERFNSHALWVSGGITSEDYVMRKPGEWPDHIFEKQYELPSLEMLKTFIETHKHLPDIPSESEVKEHGYSLKTLHYGFLKNIEELALYTIAQEEKITNQNKKISELKTRLEQYEDLKEDVKQLKATLEQLQQSLD